MFNGKQYWACEKRGFTKVYGRLGDEDLVGNVLRLSGRQRLASEGIPGGLPNSKKSDQWNHSLATAVGDSSRPE